jgi:hypothetical protein
MVEASRPLGALALSAWALAAGGGCGPTYGEWYLAKDLSDAAFCPMERVGAAVRKDLGLHDFECLKHAGEPSAWKQGAPPDPIDLLCRDPPQEIRDDAGRLRKWQALRREAARERDDSGRLYSPAIVEVAGCGKHRFYFCHPYSWGERRLECKALGEVDPRHPPPTFSIRVVGSAG